MHLIGLRVTHKTLGGGEIVDVKGEILVCVKMDDGERKTFLYPDSFSSGVLKFEEEPEAARQENREKEEAERALRIQQARSRLLSKRKERETNENPTD